MNRVNIIDKLIIFSHYVLSHYLQGGVVRIFFAEISKLFSPSISDLFFAFEVYLWLMMTVVSCQTSIIPKEASTLNVAVCTEHLILFVSG